MFELLQEEEPTTKKEGGLNPACHTNTCRGFGVATEVNGSLVSSREEHWASEDFVTKRRITTSSLNDYDPAVCLHWMISLCTQRNWTLLTMNESVRPWRPLWLWSCVSKLCSGPPLAFFAEVFPVQIQIEDVRCNGHTPLVECLYLREWKWVFSWVFNCHWHRMSCPKKKLDRLSNDSTKGDNKSKADSQWWSVIL